jgi:hypothetical protein
MAVSWPAEAELLRRSTAGGKPKARRMTVKRPNASKVKRRFMASPKKLRIRHYSGPE